jgi:hypothetical protein
MKTYIAECNEASQDFPLPEQAVQYLSQKMDVSDREFSRMVRSLTDHGYDSVSIKAGDDVGFIKAENICPACQRPL